MTRRNKPTSLAAAVLLALGSAVPGPAGAAPFQDAQTVALNQLRSASARAVEGHFHRGVARDLILDVVVPEGEPVDQARGLLGQYAGLFGGTSPDLALVASGAPSLELPGEVEFVRFSQTYRGLPVFSSSVLVGLVRSDPRAPRRAFHAGGALMSVPLEPLDVTPAIPEAQATALARAHLSRLAAPVRGQTGLVIFDPSVYRDPGNPALAWRVTLAGGAPHQVLIDAHTGAVLFEHSLVADEYEDLDLDVEDANGGTIYGTDCFNPTTMDDEIGDEDSFDSDYSGDADAVTGYYQSKSIAHWFFDVFGLTSWDADDGEVVAYVHSGLEDNAQYVHGCGMEFGDGWIGRDTVAHEFTHGVIRYSSNLTYWGESGALNESFADSMAAFADPQDDWLHGEDKNNGQGNSRSLRDPSGIDCGPPGEKVACGDVDEYSDFVYTNDDSGGVHTNSGITNKAHYLLSEGGSQNGITTQAIGNGKARLLVYVTMKLLGASAKMIDARNKMEAVAQFAIDHGWWGITATDRCMVRNAYAAVEIGQGDFDCDGVANDVDDPDGDFIDSNGDNCDFVSNPSQTDSDDDGIGNACDPDDDGDGWGDSIDNCPGFYNPGAGNLDHDDDGLGDGCDLDDDGDGALDATDNCPGDPNPSQVDGNQNGEGDACDPDFDGDGLYNDTDNCPFVYNPRRSVPGQTDTDEDGLGDACDACPDVPDNMNAYTFGYPEFGIDPEPLQPDSDGDGKPDACDATPFGATLMAVDGQAYGPLQPLEPGDVYLIEITGPPGGVVRVPLPACSPSGRTAPSARDRIELVFPGLPPTISVAVLDSAGAARGSAQQPPGSASSGLRFAPDCSETYELQIALQPGFAGQASFSLAIHDTQASGRNPWTYTPPRSGSPPPPPLPDPDDDGLHDGIDSCPLAFDPVDHDSDGDDSGDVCDVCRVWPDPDQADADANGIGNACECGDQDGSGSVDVRDLVAINLAIFIPGLATPLCDTNADDQCSVQDVIGANRKIFGAPAYCSRYP